MFFKYKIFDNCWEYVEYDRYTTFRNIVNNYDSNEGASAPFRDELSCKILEHYGFTWYG